MHAAGHRGHRSCRGPSGGLPLAMDPQWAKLTMDLMGSIRQRASRGLLLYAAIQHSMPTRRPDQRTTRWAMVGRRQWDHLPERKPNRELATTDVGFHQLAGD